MTQLFDELRACLEAQDMYASDLFDLVASYMDHGCTDIAHAFLNHFRDIMNEGCNNEQWSHVVAEGYRRVFFDSEHAKKYGTSAYHDESQLRALSASLIRSYRAGAAAPITHVSETPARVQ